jgi:putative sigma-54 modulation protein
MNIEYAARNCHLDESLRATTEARLRRVTRFLEEPVEVHLVVEVEKHRHLAELRVAHKHGLIQATEETPAAMRDAIGMAIDKVEKQAQRARKRFMDRRRRADREKQNGSHWPLAVVDAQSLRAGVPRVIETDRLEVKPMAIEDAALEMENSGHGFVVFRDTKSDRLSVLYRRADSNFGLISPDV